MKISTPGTILVTFIILHWLFTLTVYADDAFELESAIFSGKYAEAEQILRHNPNLVNRVDKFGDSPLTNAARYGRINIIRLLIKMGADVNKPKGDDTPLHVAAHWNKPEAAKILIKAGANVNARNNQKETPIYSAAGSGANKVIILLIKAGADVNIADDLGFTPLHKAARSAHLKTIELLVQHHARINQQDNLGYTALHKAIKNEHGPYFKDTIYEKRDYVAAVRLLLKLGADPNIKSRYGATALSIARRKSQTKEMKAIVKMLEKATR